MRVIVAGGRDFNNYALLKERLKYYLGDRSVEIVSGDAIGADKLGERYAKENNHPIKKFPADWDTYKKSAGPIRNKQMAEYATHCICFWDGKSTGTADMIKRAKNAKLQLRIVRY